MSGAFGVAVTLGQANGPDVQLNVFGDEFYARYETLDGFAAVYDTKAGLFCYGQLSGGRLISTTVPISRPPPPGLERHLKESNEVRQAMAAARAAHFSPPAEPAPNSTEASHTRRPRSETSEDSSSDMKDQ